MSHDEASWHLLANLAVDEDSDEELLPTFTRRTLANGWPRFVVTGAGCRRVGAAMLSGLKAISIRKWILSISGIFTLAVVIILKLDEYSRQYHPMFRYVLDFQNSQPQHNPDLPWPEGRNGRFIYFSGHLWEFGYNNVLQEQLLNTYLAYISNRAFVYSPHITHDHNPFMGIKHLRIPAGAFSYSPTSGAPFSQSRNGTEGSPSDGFSPRAVSEEYFRTICPWWKTIRLSASRTSESLGLDLANDDFLTVMVAWSKKLSGLKEPCVDINDGMLFHWKYFNDPRILPLWSAIGTSPVLTQWDWSPMIHAELEHLGFPVPEESPAARVRQSLPPSHPWARPKIISSMKGDFTRNKKDISTPFVISKLVAVHIRRGDYEEHCRTLANEGLQFNSWDMLGTYSTKDPTPPHGLDPKIYPIDPRFINETLPALPDTLYSPPYSTAFPHDRHGRVDPAELSREQLYKLHCWPNLTAILNKLRDVKDLHPGLEEVYVMTNGTPEFVEGLTHLLHEGGWRSVKSSLDLKLTDAAVAVSQAVDMALATWAEVFVGNGYSSLTSNTVGFRLAQGHKPRTNHFF